MSKPRIFVSFSGGRSSAYMAQWIKRTMGETHDLLFVFANTGQEHEETLKFVRRCDEAFGLGVVWVEADVQFGARVSTKHRIVTFETASRNGLPFEHVIQKYGIPNQKFPHCTRELKLNPMYSYVDSVWPERDYQIAVGLRIDEQRRRRKDAEFARIVYPLMDWHPIDKEDVNAWWEEQPFKLNLTERQGNCVWCWKKSDRKHLLNLADDPESYEFPDRMEKLYPDAGAGNGGRVFFRGNRSTQDLIALSQIAIPDERMGSRDDEDGGCSESCEAFGEQQLDLFDEAAA